MQSWIKPLTLLLFVQLALVFALNVSSFSTKENKAVVLLASSAVSALRKSIEKAIQKLVPSFVSSHLVRNLRMSFC